MPVPFSDLQAIAPSSVIELFELQLFANLHGGNETYRFHAGSSLNASGDIVWAGNSYLRYPVEVEGFEYSGNGQLPRPKIRVSNILSTISAILATVNGLSAGNDLTGARVTRIRTLARYIDGVNFPGGTNPLGTPDPTVEFPREVYFIDRKAAETRDLVEFELAAAFDLAGVRAPKRQCISSVCQWVYRGAECGYSGPPVANTNDEPLTGVTLSPLYGIYQTAENNLTSARAALNTATVNLNAASNTLNISSGEWKLAETRYNGSNYVGYGVYGGNTFAYWDGSVVSLGSEYRRGAQKAVSTGYFSFINYEIQRWFYDNSQYAAALASYNSALSAYNTAKANYDSALAARNTALANWQTSPQFVGDINASGDDCGKRLSSCKLRFGPASPLPFGSFPGVGSYYS